MPPGSQPVAILCIGPVAEFPPSPLLQTSGWNKRLPIEDIVYVDRWRDGAKGTAVMY